MNSAERQTQIKLLIGKIETKQKEIEDARRNEKVFSEVKALYLELKDLNRQLTQVLEQVDLNPHH